jgi:TRAP-type C4-dicarboxylate transport system permease small subunit
VEETKTLMDGLLRVIFRLSQGGNRVAGVTLTLVMGLTVADVILRILGRPMVGVFELVAFFGALVIGFSIPFTSWVRGHIFVDFLIMRFSKGVRKGIHVFTRLLGLGLFDLIGWNLIKMGTDLQRSGEVSPTLHVPFYPVVYGIGMVCLIQGLVMIADIVKVMKEQYE